LDGSGQYGGDLKSYLGLAFVQGVMLMEKSQFSLQVMYLDQRIKNY